MPTRGPLNLAITNAVNPTNVDMPLPSVRPPPIPSHCQNRSEPTYTDISWNVRKGSASRPFTVHQLLGNGSLNATPPGRQSVSPLLFSEPDLTPQFLPTCNANDAREQGSTFLFRPTFRVGHDTGPITCTEAQLHGLLLLENIKQQVNQLATTVNVVLARLGTRDGQPTYEMPDFQFPLDSIEEVRRFEEWLQNPQHDCKKQALVTSFSSVGGVDVKRVTWNISASMCSCSVARRINWKGVNEKMALKKMASKVILTRAVRNCATTAQATDDEICHRMVLPGP
ncbi:uncharacterized protein LOC121680240 isoform X2 [Alosa sapidissima]|uniref:uncharacterized protein LOC121680240 isoform X2 n=1 Tax=Alosa sapidissima TaxID=34773 RepID=UPI001C0989D1|nr:uncharacterized protein LOC121680240 isoform X2 [Alosa sapidissima]